jgi:YhcH/YjgK/YiaL family protein
MKNLIAAIVLKTLVIAFLITHTQAQETQMSSKEINNWYKEKKWMNGLSRVPHKSVNKVEFARQYQGNKEWWDKAFAYLRETDLANLKPGRYPIDGENVFAIVSEGATKELDKTKWEAHQNYQDIHFVITGKEKIGITPVASASISTEYDASKDIAFYNSKGKYYLSDPNNFFIVFTQDAHRPGVRAEGVDTVKKVVVKVRKSA